MQQSALRFLLLLVFPLQAWAMAAGVKVDAVRTATVTETVAVLGQVVAQQGGVIAARGEGVVLELPVQVGDVVAEGDLVALLEDLLPTAQLMTAEAEQAQAAARLINARANSKLAAADLRRINELRNSAAFSQAERENREHALAVAEAEVREAEAAAQAARVAVAVRARDLTYAKVLAPFPGVVTARHTNEGAYVPRGNPVISLINTARLEVEAQVPVALLHGVRPGNELRLMFGDRTVTAVVRAIVPEENVTARTRPLRLSLPAADLPSGIGVGQSVSVALPSSAQAEQLTVHKDAITRNGPQAMVFLAKDGKAEIRPVQLGAAVGSRFIVLDGLAAGDLVVVRGNERLRPGQDIAFEKPAR